MKNRGHFLIVHYCPVEGRRSLALDFYTGGLWHSDH